MSAPEGFTEFVTARSAVLQRAAWLLTGDAGRAEDLLQTALAKAWRHWNTVAATGSPEAYVRRVLFTTYATWWRRRWRAETPSDAYPDRAGQADVADETANRDSVYRALTRLSRQQRAIVVLRYVEDLSVSATAAVLDCSEATVKTQSSRALATMRTDPQLQMFQTGEISS
ncbi:SigE family RNA polymerase sigma factor [Planosporangium flavigriseum]|uniref:DNA-directed RNA polymerase sigma-70 factor n=1 Tax=Planosporangium flavigriseum TaxID=373681 RepID=A0A8J3PNA4_9ACTN|nr:SigE family RNA polymerase sigma factor [Planosporangium flavigriseum]NJC67649.1 SigE family RNA polymerase sigma factor [Planosporangium flavigriseum]GIG75782.1 DNA-directed RNA polymerase sigma-70 factor [Planosporangium flavigriseum]